MGIAVYSKKPEVPLLPAGRGSWLISTASDLPSRVEGGRRSDEAKQVASDLMLVLVLLCLAVQLIEAQEVVKRAILSLLRVIGVPLPLLILRIDVGPPGGVIAVQRRWKVAGSPSGEIYPIDILICPRLKCMHLVLCERGHADRLDAVTKLPVDPTARRAQEDSVCRVDVGCALFAAVGTCFVARALEEPSNGLLVLLLNPLLLALQSHHPKNVK
jgi:hypothetical protein